MCTTWPSALVTVWISIVPLAAESAPCDRAAMSDEVVEEVLDAGRLVTGGQVCDRHDERVALRVEVAEHVRRVVGGERGQQPAGEAGEQAAAAVDQVLDEERVVGDQVLEAVEQAVAAHRQREGHARDEHRGAGDQRDAELSPEQVVEHLERVVARLGRPTRAR